MQTFIFQHYWYVSEGWPVDFSFTEHLIIQVEITQSFPLTGCSVSRCCSCL